MSKPQAFRKILKSMFLTTRLETSDILQRAKIISLSCDGRQDSLLLNMRAVGNFPGEGIAVKERCIGVGRLVGTGHMAVNRTVCELVNEILPNSHSQERDKSATALKEKTKTCTTDGAGDEKKMCQEDLGRTIKSIVGWHWCSCHEFVAGLEYGFNAASARETVVKQIRDCVDGNKQLPASTVVTARINLLLMTLKSIETSALAKDRFRVETDAKSVSLSYAAQRWTSVSKPCEILFNGGDDLENVKGVNVFYCY